MARLVSRERTSQPWTDDDLSLLAELAGSGALVPMIAKRLGRTQGSIEKMARTRGIQIGPLRLRRRKTE